MPVGDRMGAALQLLPIALILVPLGLHFVLVNFVLLSNTAWLPLTYLFSHLFFFIVGLWTVQDKEAILPVVVYIFVVVVTMLTDVIQLGLYFGDYENLYGQGEGQPDAFVSVSKWGTLSRTWQFSAGMTIINLIGKPITIVLACVAVYFRTGASIPGFRGSGTDTYQPVHGSSGGN